MDPQRFDDLTRTVAGGVSRRRLLAGAAAALGGALNRRPAAAACAAYGRPCAADGSCCNGSTCQGGVCRCPARAAVCNTASGPACVACPPGQILGAGCRCLCKTTGQPPVGGVCPCPNGQTACGGACVDTASDAAHCGGCGADCLAALPNTATAACQQGICRAASCALGWADCDGDSANGCETPLGTIDDCGACGDACPGIPNGAPVCEAGACATACLPGFKRCAVGGPCVPDESCCTPADCRAADAANCEAAPICDAGACVYPPADHATVCRDPSCAGGTATAPTVCTGAALGCPDPPAPVPCDPYVCDGQGLACLATCAVNGDCVATSYCDAAGRCVPDEGLGGVCAEDGDCASGVCCAATCVDLATDDQHCGACGDACPGTEHGEAVCEAGICATVCSAGFKRCVAGGPCLPDTACCDAAECPAADPANCEAAPSCAAGECVYASTCEADEVCADGACVCAPTAPATYTDALGTGSPTYAACGRPGSFYYAAYPVTHCGWTFQVSLAGDGSGGTLRFPRVELFEGGFDPANPCANKIGEGIYACETAEISNLAQDLAPGSYVVVATSGFPTSGKPPGSGTYMLTLGSLVTCPL
jgi:hypothetical protein